MKVFISADIEGVTGVTHWDETDLDKAVSASACEQMTAEVAAACEGAIQAGATEILIKDAHDSGRNIIASKLPREARLIRGWAPHPFMMMQELDKTFQAAAMIGYHSRARMNTSPLAHTMTGSFTRVTVNDRDVSEFLLNTYTAAMLKVPVVFVSGDKGLCEEVTGLNPAIGTIAVKEGIGNSTVNIHPELAIARIKEGMAKALKSDLSKCQVALPDNFSLDIQFKDHSKAYTYAFYPGAKLKDPVTVHYEHTDYFEVLRFLFFAG
ncbi:MAG: M55 family metallopeptidase [Anaerolineales bacterium]|nr:M55 family metallopeptidase [Anaerolineales bacterium]